MAQDLIPWPDEDLREIYEGVTPVAARYPGGVEIEWLEIERRIERRAKASVRAMGGRDEASRIYAAFFGELAYPRDRVELSFRVFGILPGSFRSRVAMPRGDTQRPPIELFTSRDLDWWEGFVALLAATERVEPRETGPWRWRMEEQLFVCVIRALRRAFPAFAGGVYAGHDEDADEEFVNRSSYVSLVPGTRGES